MFPPLAVLDLEIKPLLFRMKKTGLILMFPIARFPPSPTAWAVILLFTSRISVPALTVMLPPLLPGAEVLMELFPVSRMEPAAPREIAPAAPDENDADWTDAPFSIRREPLSVIVMLPPRPSPVVKAAMSDIWSIVTVSA